VPFLSIIVPVLNGEKFLPACLEAIERSTFRDWELIVVDDGSTDASAALAHVVGARAFATQGRTGPANARNTGSAHARGEVLVFVDADVNLHADALERFAALFRSDAGCAAVFGSYDTEPSDPHFVSQYKNLFHHFVHQEAPGPAETFWAGCGAVRKAAFEACGGFSVAFGRPSIEDIELGMRLRAAGYRILLDPAIQGTHAKRWTLTNLVRTDLFDRAIPWTRLVLERGETPATLNLKVSQQLCGVVACLAVATALLSLVLWNWRAALASQAMVGVVVAMNAGFYRFFAKERGWWFAIRVVPMHLLYYVYSVTGFAVGTVTRRRVRQWNV
jgi:glycosyltransferase involved in cell wall biosynthesis